MRQVMIVVAILIACMSELATFTAEEDRRIETTASVTPAERRDEPRRAPDRVPEPTAAAQPAAPATGLERGELPEIDVSIGALLGARRGDSSLIVRDRDGRGVAGVPISARPAGGFGGYLLGHTNGRGRLTFSVSETRSLIMRAMRWGTFRGVDTIEIYADVASPTAPSVSIPSRGRPDEPLVLTLDETVRVHVSVSDFGGTPQQFGAVGAGLAVDEGIIEVNAPLIDGIATIFAAPGVELELQARSATGFSRPSDVARIRTPGVGSLGVELRLGDEWPRLGVRLLDARGEPKVCTAVVIRVTDTSGHTRFLDAHTDASGRIEVPLDSEIDSAAITVEVWFGWIPGGMWAKLEPEVPATAGRMTLGWPLPPGEIELGDLIIEG